MTIAKNGPVDTFKAFLDDSLSNSIVDVLLGGFWGEYAIESKTIFLNLVFGFDGKLSFADEMET